MVPFLVKQYRIWDIASRPCYVISWRGLKIIIDEFDGGWDWVVYDLHAQWSQREARVGDSYPRESTLQMAIRRSMVAASNYLENEVYGTILDR
jgi:hypothetical protein